MHLDFIASEVLKVSQLVSSIRQNLGKTLRKFVSKSQLGSRSSRRRVNRLLLDSFEPLEERRVLAAAFHVNSYTGFFFTGTPPSPATVGTDVSLTRSFTTRTLGVFDSGLDGFNLSTSPQVGIWNSGGTRLASGTVSSSSPLNDSYRYVTLAAPVTLGAGTYYIGAYYPGNDFFPARASFSTATNVSSTGVARFSSARAFDFPINLDTGGNSGYFAGNFIEMLPPQLTGPSSVSANEASTATANGSYSLAGEPFTLTASSGSVTQTANDALSGTWSWSQGTSDGPVSSTITITATGTLSGKTQTFSFTLNVLNVGPTAVLNGPNSGTIGQSVTYNLTGATDPSATDTGAGFRYSYSVGDTSSLAASYSAASTSNSFTFSLPDKSSFTLYARIYDRDNGFTQYTKTITVTNTIPTVTSTSPFNLGFVNDSVSSIVMTFSEPVTATTAQDIRNYRLKGPSGVIPLTSATLNGTGTTATLAFPIQTAGGSYSLTVGNVSDLAGNRMAALNGYQAANVYSVPQLSPALGLATGDFNGDGLQDIVAAGNGLVLMPGQAGAPFFGNPVSVGLNASSFNASVEAADLNRDGKLDLIVTEESNGLSVYLGNGNGTFQGRQTRFANGTCENVEVVDVNNDGLLDLVAANVGTNGLTTFLNNGSSFLSWSAQFSSGLPSNSWDVHAAGDLNGDGRLDLVITPFGTSAYVVVGTATPGVFLYTGLGFASGANTEHSAVADVDGDGRLDLLSGGSIGVSNGGSIKYGTSAAPYFDTTQGLDAVGSNHATNILASDLDADGDLEVIRGVWGTKTIEISRNQGGRVFSSEVINLPTSLSGFTWQVRATDLNSDGLPDIIGTDYSSQTVYVIRSVASPVTLTFTLNHSPVAFNDTANVTEDISPTASGNVLSNDSDSDPGTTLSAIIFSSVIGTYGNLLLSSNGAYTYSLNNSAATVQALAAGQQVRDTFSYRAYDSKALSNIATITITINGQNDTPSGLNLSSTTIVENSLADALVGTFSSADLDAGETFIYSLVAGLGSTDNAAFTISGNQLKVDASLDFEAQSVYSIRARTTDSGGLTFDQTFVINVTDVNEAPYDIALSVSNIDENTPVGSTIGTLSSSDLDSVNTFTYSLVNGIGSEDNASFTISDNLLKTAANIDFETKSSYSIRVRSQDQGGLFVEKIFTINVNNLTEVSGLDVQLGQTQRSYVRNVDILFDQSSGLASLLGGGRVQVTKRDLQGNNPTPVAAPTMSVAGKSIRLDFGANGLGGNRNATSGDGYYEVGVDVDGDGSYESKLHFFRLLGDVNGDGMVDNADLLQIAGASGYSPENDVNGDGVVNTNDRTLAQRSLNRRLASGLQLDD